MATLCVWPPEAWLCRIILIMPNNKVKRSAPFSLRLTQEERSRLESRANGLPLGTYVRAQLLGTDKAVQRRTRSRFPVRDHRALAQALALIGRSELASNMRELALVTRSGSLPVTPETDSALRNACADIALIKQLLMKALGIRER